METQVAQRKSGRWPALVAAILFVYLEAALLGSSWVGSSAAATTTPQPLLPATDDVVITPTFSWLPAAGAVKYKIQVGPQSDLNAVYWESTTLNLNLTPNTAIPNGPLYWRVGSYQTGDTQPSAWSEKLNFRKYIPAPILTAPPDHIALTAPVFRWNPLAGAAYYKIEITQDAGFTAIDATFTTYNPSFTPNSTLPHGTYYWRVRGVDAGGNEGENSAIWSFVKRIPPPKLLAPVDQLWIVFPSLSWSAVEDAAYYRVEISPNVAFNPITFSDITYATRLTPSNTLPHGTLYWRVRGVDADGHEGENSAPGSFIKYIEAPKLISPANNANVTLPVFEWSPVEGAVTYKVEVSQLASFNSLADTYTTYQARLIPSQSLPAGNYFWRVTGLDSDNHSGQISDARSFTLSAPPAASAATPILQTPTEGEVIPSDPVFRWTRVAGAASYLLKVSTSPTFTSLYDSLTVKYPAYAPYDAGLKFTYATGSYYWKVEAKNASNQVIATSLPGSFTKTAQLLLTGPDDQASLPEDPSYTWTPVAGAKTYLLQVSTSAAFSSIYDSVTVDYPIYTPYTSGLIHAYPNDTYYWKVTARSSTGSTITTSQPRSFTKQALLHLSGPDNGAVLLADPRYTWDRMPGAKSYYLKVSTNAGFSSTYDAVTTDYTSYSPYSAGMLDSYVNGSYYWKVEARGPTGTVLATSPVFSFIRQQTIGLDTPSEAVIEGSTPSFAWERVVGAKTYLLQVSGSPTFSSIYDSITTAYTAYTPFLSSLKDTYALGTYYWRVQAKRNTGATIATSQVGMFTISSSQPTSTPIGAPTATQTLTPSPLPPTLPPPAGEFTPTPPGPLPPAGPPPSGLRTIGSVKVYADLFTDLGDGRVRASGRVRLGSATAAYVLLGTGEAIFDTGSMTLEGSSDSLVSLKLDNNTAAPVFAGPFQVDVTTGEMSTLLNTVFQLASLGDLGVETSLPLAQFSINVLQGTVGGETVISIYPIEGMVPSARLSFTLNHNGSVSGSMGAGDLSFEAGGVTFEVESATFIYTPGAGGKFTVSSATISLPEAFDLGATGSVNDLVISAEGLESVGGGSVTLELPNMAVPGTEGQFELAGASFTLSLDAEGNYYIQGRADFSVPNISSKGDANTTYSGSFYAEFELNRDGLTYVLLGGEIDPGIPIGQTGFVLTTLEGRVDLQPLVRVQITGTLQTSIEVPPLGPLVSGEPTIWVQLEEPYEIGISGSVKVLIFDAAQASLVLSQSSGMTGTAHINYLPYAMEGDASLHIWRASGEFHFTGSATVTLGFHKGALGSYWGIDLPPTDLTFAELSTKFGEFCSSGGCTSTVYGFKGAVDLSIDATCPRIGIPPWQDCSFDLFSYAFFIDLDGNLDYGSSLDQYQLVDQAALVAANPAYGPDTRGLLASTHSTSFDIEPTDLAMVGIEWTSGKPTLELFDPKGERIATDTVYAGLGFTSSETSFVYLIQNPPAGRWTAVISNLSGNENYTFRALGRNQPPQIVLTDLSAGLTGAQNGLQSVLPTSYIIQWKAVESDPGARLALYYDSDDHGTDGTLIAGDLDPQLGSYTWDVSQVKSGDYYIYATIDDLKNLPITSYFTETVTVLNTQPPGAPSGLQVQLASLRHSIQACWTLNPEPDVIGYRVYFGTQSGVYDLGSFNAANLGCYRLAVPDGLAKGYIAVSAYDNSGNTGPLSPEQSIVIPVQPTGHLLFLPLVKR